MSVFSNDIIRVLDDEDKKKLEYFARLLLRQEKYHSLQKEIADRRKEIENEEILSHDDFWDAVNV